MNIDVNYILQKYKNQYYNTHHIIIISALSRCFHHPIEFRNEIREATRQYEQRLHD